MQFKTLQRPGISVKWISLIIVKLSFYKFNCFTVHFDLLYLIYTKKCTFLYNNVLIYNVNIKTLKKLQHVSICIQPPEDDLNRDRNMLERFKCFNINVID